MCQFCIEHGDGQKWYLEASSYSADLSSDLRRRGYLVDFIRDFGRNRSRLLTILEHANSAPTPVAEAVRGSVSRRLQRVHFGQPVPIEDCERILDITTSIVNVPCPCRLFAGGPEEGYCLCITTRPIDDALAEGFADYDLGPDTSAFQRLSKDEAVALLRRCEDQGLMHSVWTFVTPWIGAICNCDLKSGCMAMTLTRSLETKIMWRGEYIAVLDADSCSGCCACVERCPFVAIEAAASSRAAGTPVGDSRVGDSRVGDVALVRTEDCWGCGVCRSACSVGAITLVDRAAIPEAAAVW